MKLTSTDIRRIDPRTCLVVVARPSVGHHLVSLVRVRKDGSVMETEVLDTARVDGRHFKSVGQAAASLLRWYDKCSGGTHYTRSSRNRRDWKGDRQ